MISKEISRYIIWIDTILSYVNPLVALLSTSALGRATTFLPPFTNFTNIISSLEIAISLKLFNIETKFKHYWDPFSLEVSIIILKCNSNVEKKIVCPPINKN